MRIIVQKFGGTSVAHPEKRAEAARRVVQAYHNGYRPVVVVSAMGRKGEPYATDTLIELAHGVDLELDMDGRDLDLLMACGEIISTVLMAQGIRSLGGIKAIPLSGGQAGIVTDRNFNNARILHIKPENILAELAEDKVVVVAGFQGITMYKDVHRHGDVTTLGRGGSDATAVALGAVLKAERVEIFTDVEGVMTGDPRLVGPDARTLRSISHAEICEMAHLGAKVVQARAAVIARQHNVETWVKSPTSDSPGTVVRRLEPVVLEGITTVAGVAQSEPVARINVHIPIEADRRPLEQEIYAALSVAAVAVHFVSNTNEEIEFVVEREQLHDVRAVFDGLLIPVGDEAQPSQRRVYVLCPNARSAFFRAQVEQVKRLRVKPITVPVLTSGHCIFVSLVMGHIANKAAVMATMLEALRTAEVKVLQLADSDHSVSCLINEEDKNRAVLALHNMMNAKVAAGEWVMTDR